MLINGKTIQVVSNNNSATANVLEKLSGPKYNMGFIVAPLGSTKNKEEFINKQSTTYPDISTWEENIDILQSNNTIKDIKESYPSIEIIEIDTLNNISVEDKNNKKDYIVIYRASSSLI